MNSLRQKIIKNQTALGDSDAIAVLAREAGLPFQPPIGKVDPITEWLSLMEVVQVLCPAWPVRTQSMHGKEWRL